MESEDIRQWHYMRRLSRTTVPTSIMVVDTETHNVLSDDSSKKQIHKLRLWVSCSFRYEKGNISRESWQMMHTQDAFWTEVKRRSDNKRPLWVFTHNAGFDMTVLGLWKMAVGGEIEFVQVIPRERQRGTKKPRTKWTGIAVLDDPPTILKFRFKDTAKTVVVVDTFNYFRMSLEAIGESIGRPKCRMPLPTDDMREWFEYCRNDVEVLRSAIVALLQLVDREQLGEFGYTISSVSHHAYRARFIPQDVQILVHGSKDILELERASYHGGACQCWFVGVVSNDHPALYWPVVPKGSGRVYGTNVYNLDVQAFYPAMMNKYKYPYRLAGVYECPSYRQLQELQKETGVIAQCQLDCGEPGFPVTRKGRTFYAKGRICTTLAGPELQRAIDEDCIASVGRVSTYYLTDLFSEFVQHFWQLRNHYTECGNKAFAYACKLIMNSLYGKFAQYRSRWTEAEDMVAPIPMGHWWERKLGEEETHVYRSLGWLPQKQAGKGEHPESFPAISSFVTSYGREEILRLVCIAGADSCLYSDTDSLHVDEKGYYLLKDAGEICTGALGRLSLRNTWGTVEYRGPKNYTADGIDVIAGIRKKAQKVRRDQYKQERFQRLTSILANKQLDSVAIDWITLNIQTWQPLGDIGPDGRVSTPTLAEW